MTIGKIYQQIALNKSEISQPLLDIANKVRSNPLTWNGQFSPQLVQVLLSHYAKRGDRIFDPFLGSGTVLLEAGRVNLSACGTEINPAAVTLAQTYRFTNIPLDARRHHLSQVRSLLNQKFGNPPLPLFQHGNVNTPVLHEREIKTILTELIFHNRDRWQRQLLETLVTLLDFHKPALSTERVFATWNRLTRLVVGLPYSREPIQVYHADARQTPLPDRSVDIVITSPPYINVLNYHQQYRASMEALKWDLLKIAKSEIGSNRKHRGNRFLTVIQYCLDMSQVLDELMRVCRPTSRLIFIMGRESTVQGTRFFNGEIVAEIAYAMGIDLILRQERVFLNRFGQKIFEDILHFSLPKGLVRRSFLDDARAVAGAILRAAYLSAPQGAKSDIESALDRINAVKPSPILDLSQVRQ